MKIAETLCVVCLYFSPATVWAEPIAGVVQWGQVLELNLPQSGVIKSVLVRAGQHIKAGDLLLSLDSRQQKANLQAARAVLKYANSQQAEAKTELSRIQDLYDQTLISQRELDKGLNVVAATKAKQAEAHALVVKTTVILEQSQLRAPFNGRIAALHVHAGQSVSNVVQVQNLLSVVETQTMRVVVLVDAIVLAALQLDQVVSVNVANKTYNGRVTALNLSENVTGQYQVDISFTPQAKMNAGLAGKVEF
jgi:RND family efflux transporter MFP subunit